MRLRRAYALPAALAGAVAAAIALLLPPARPTAVLPFDGQWQLARGAYHVHSHRSDGTGTLDDIARAASRAGLRFVVVTDHGDGTRPLDPPTYRHGVLIIDGTEISSDEGHYVALAHEHASYRLAGTASNVVNDVRRLGGFGIAAHPGSPKEALRWRDWTVPIDALEWLNADSEWRDELWGSLGRVLLTYAFRPVETLAGLLDRPAAVLAQWDRLTLTRRVPALAGADAHARLGWGSGGDPYEERIVARVPSYEVSFRAFTNHVILDAGFSGDPELDSRTVLAAITTGRMITVVEGLAVSGFLEVHALSGANIARPGEYLDVAGAVALTIRSGAPEGTRLTVYRNGQSLYETTAASARVEVGAEPAVYRVEAQLPWQEPSGVPWILTNPIYVGMRAVHEAHAAATQTASFPGEVHSRTAVPTEWFQAEASAGSRSILASMRLSDGTPALQWEFSLAEGARASQYAAMRFPLEGRLADNERLLLRVESDRPRRVWAQLRAGGGELGQRSQRWGQTFYVDAQLTGVDLRLSDFRPLDLPSAPVTDSRTSIDSLLLVVDTLHHAPGTNGRLRITDLWLAR